jgi:hypothetical protein
MPNEEPPHRKTPPHDFANLLDKIEIPFFAVDEVWKKAAQYQFWYSVLGLIVGTICVVGGIILFIHGIVGRTSWTASVLGMNSQLTDAAPGSIFGILGLFIIWVTKFKVKAVK